MQRGSTHESATGWSRSAAVCKCVEAGRVVGWASARLICTHVHIRATQSLTLERTGRANFCERHQRVAMSVGFRKEVYTNSKKNTHARACYRYQACPKDAAARTGCTLTRTPTPVCTRTIFQAKASKKLKRGTQVQWQPTPPHYDLQREQLRSRDYGLRYKQKNVR
jgi:hypothetical protein